MRLGSRHTRRRRARGSSRPSKWLVGICLLLTRLEHEGILMIALHAWAGLVPSRSVWNLWRSH